MANKKKAKKKAPAKPQQQMSPKNYILTGRTRKLPIGECWISPDWKEAGMCTIVVTRQHSSGNLTFGVYLVDTFCLGLKNTNAIFNKPDYEYEDYFDKIFDAHGGREPIDYVLAHNIIYGAIAYAEDLGFKPDKDWVLSQMILEDDTDDVALIEVEFGKDGKPFFINGPYDNVQKVVNTLKKSVGEGNFEMTYIMGKSDTFDRNFDYHFNDDDADDDDDFEDDDDVEDVDYEEVK